MKITKNSLLCRKPAGRCARVTKVDRRKKLALMQDPFSSYWVLFSTLRKKWRLPGT